ncbi:terminase [Alteromonas sp. IB21]|uniref:terminase n=1 Tax=Alteromonas sp. IB21 TaxID=2779369 RepID=UPI0018E859DE|nr:terminase [Alteromonas sp. IB21]MBJ2129067.1 terminase [Alteromonas sp. IB21]
MENPEVELVNDIAEFYADPLGYVLYAFPWGEKGGPLEDFDGPDKWQREQLLSVGKAIQDDPETTIQEAIASGHGIGKSAETSWIILWAMSTRPHLAGWVTANTQSQLKSKTWRELSVWHKRAINAHWFEWTATRFFHVEHQTTWGLDAIPWSEHNSEAFAGLHAEYVLMIMDEASAIADVIWEVAEGAMTTPRAMWFCFGNPTRNTGRFRECFRKYRHRWNGRKIDSRTCKMTNKSKLKEWEDDHGVDSDFFRIRVRGEFPNSDVNQLINTLAIERAAKTKQLVSGPLKIGVDPARFGDDETSIIRRRNRSAYKVKSYKGLCTMTLAGIIVNIIKEESPDQVAIDVGGLGAGVYDRLVELGYKDIVVAVNFGGTANDPERYYNKRSEMWGEMKDWIEDDVLPVSIPDDDMLQTDLETPLYSYDSKGRLVLEKKDDMKKRIGRSPDKGDSLALTFAEPIKVKKKQTSAPTHTVIDSTTGY